jgi:hypothetical protein
MALPYDPSVDESLEVMLGQAPVESLYRGPMDWRPILLAIGPGLVFWAAGLALSRRATEPSATLLGGRITTLGFALVFLGLALLLVLSAVLTSSSLAAPG